MTSRSLGFTLVELAVVLLVLGLLLGGLLLPLATQVYIVRMKETKDALDKVQEALLGFAIANGNLPCPARDDLGLADCSWTPDTDGFLPWRTLGVGRYDAWGNAFRYHPDENFMTAIGFPPDTAGTLRVEDRTGAQLTPTTDCGMGQRTPNGPAAIVFSLGENGEADLENAVTNGCSAVPPSVHVYIQDVYLEGVFDDVLIWLSKNILVSRLATAGTWPP